MKKRIISLILIAVMIVSSTSTHLKIKNDTVYAAEEEAPIIFAQGTGTGIDFNEASWNFNGAYRDGYGLNYASAPSEYKTGIKSNKYSGNNEDVIRLIDGVETKAGDDHDFASGYRSGTAFLKNGIRLNSGCSFSAKFTISMPNAIVDDDGINTREPGGEGIAFVIQPSSNPVGKAGGGMGYENINNSISIELDSFFNGGYYSAEDGAGYTNWGFDNQIYNYDNGNYTGYNLGVLSSKPYIGIVANKYQRFDHIGLSVNGNPLSHRAIYYLEGNNPIAVDGSNKYLYLDSNITDITGAENPADIQNPSRRFTDYTDDSTPADVKNAVNNRLFTVWVEYDGEGIHKLQVRIALGDYKTAVRPSDYNITYTFPMNADLEDVLGSETVYFGFTSAVSESKANHTVHSVAIANEYYPNGIPTESTYQVEYYLEGSEGYELQTADKLTNQSAAIGETVTAPNKTYAGYTETTVANTLKSAILAADGSTVLKVFYNRNTNTGYKVEYYLENTDGTYTREDLVNKTGTTGVSVTADSKTYTGYSKATTANSKESGTIAGDGSTVLKVYYNRNTNTGYKVEYYLQNTDGTYTREDLVNKTGTTGASITAESKSYPDYIKVTTANSKESGTIAGDGSTILKVYYNKKTLSTISITCADIVYGSNISYSVQNSTGGTQTIEYKVRGANDSTYTQTAPKSAGDYTIRVSEVETGTYAKGSATCDFKINKKPISMTVNIANKQYNGLNTGEIASASLNDSDILSNGAIKDSVSLGTPYPAATFASANVGSDIAVSFGVFTLTGADAGNYVLTQPTSITGNIVNNYEPVKGTDYTVTSGDWINTAFTVTAKAGYELSFTNTAGGAWNNTLSKNDENANGSMQLYIRNKSTGVISKMVTESYKIDKTKPVISGVTEGDTYYTDKVVTVTDTNLDTITVNGEPFANGSTLAGNKNVTYVIVATDKAGNSTTVTVKMKSNADISGNEAGKIHKDVITEGKVPKTVFNNNLRELEALVLTAEEKQLVEAGLDVKIYLELKDISATIDSADKALVTNNTIGYKVGDYIDISLFKKIGDNIAQRISNPSGLISITLKIPEHLKPTEDGVTRTYKILRVHEGESTIIDGKYDASIGEFTFETDKFSTYAIIYNDVIEEAKVDPPSTKDMTQTWLWYGLLVISVVVFSVRKFSFRKEEKEE